MTTPPRPKENDEWIRENYSLYPSKELWEMYCTKFKKMSYQGFKNLTRSLGLTRKKRRSEEELQWVRDNCIDKTADELVELYSKKFRPISRHDMLHLTDRLGLNIERKVTYYSDEEIAWLKEMYPHHSTPELVKMFSEKYRPTTKTALASLFTKLGITNKLDTSRLTEEQDKWLMDNYENKSLPELAEEFSSLFYEVDNIRIGEWLRYRGIHKRGICVRWTEEELNWLRDVMAIYDSDTVVRMYKDKFGTDRNMSVPMLNDLRRNYNLPLSEAQKEYVVNKKSKANEEKARDIGTLSVVGGTTMIKVANEKYGSVRNFIPYKYYVWEQANGKVPKGYNVICIDGDETNCSLDNLMMVSVSTRNKLKWRNKTIASGDAELKKLYILQKQLEDLLGQ